jgi:hypothetical protein
MRFDFKMEYVAAISSVGKSIGAGLATVGLAGAWCRGWYSFWLFGFFFIPKSL